MNVFDFDNTLYKGESPLDFFLYCFHRKPALIRHMPLVIKMGIQYKRNLLKIEDIDVLAALIIEELTNSKINLDTLVTGFWKKNVKKLHGTMLSIIKEEDVIITASPDFLIFPIQDKLIAKTIICTKLNLETKKFELLCYNTNKVTAFKELFPDRVIDNFYSDSFADLPMMALAKNAFLVKKGKIVKKVKNIE